MGHLRVADGIDDTCLSQLECRSNWLESGLRPQTLRARLLQLLRGSHFGLLGAPGVLCLLHLPVQEVIGETLKVHDAAAISSCCLSCKSKAGDLFSLLIRECSARDGLRR